MQEASKILIEQLTKENLEIKDTPHTVAQYIQTEEYKKNEERSKEQFLKHIEKYPLTSWRVKIRNPSPMDVVSGNNYTEKVGSQLEKDQGLTTELIRAMEEVASRKGLKTPEEKEYLDYLLKNVPQEALSIQIPSMDCSIRTSIVASGLAEHLSPEQLNSSHLKEMDRVGRSIAHHLAQQGKLKLIKDGPIEADIMNIRDLDGNNPVHDAYLAHKENELPKTYKVTGYAFVALDIAPKAETKEFKLKDIEAYTRKNRDGISPQDMQQERTQKKPKGQENEPTIS